MRVWSSATPLRVTVISPASSAELRHIAYCAVAISVAAMSNPSSITSCQGPESVAGSSWATTEQDITRSVDSFETALADVMATFA
jgi:hypothetical protein